MAMFHLLKIRTIIDIFKNEKCKVTFGLEYINVVNEQCILQIVFKRFSNILKDLLSLITRKHVYLVFDQVGFQPVCAARNPSGNLEFKTQQQL